MHSTPAYWLTLLLVLRKNCVNWISCLVRSNLTSYFDLTQFHSMCQMRNGILLKSGVSEICVNQIRVNRAVDVHSSSARKELNVKHLNM